MRYEIKILPTALKSLKSLDKSIIERIFNKLEWLADSFDEINPLPLKGSFAELYKLRTGDYRVIYSFNRTKKIIFVHLAGHRKDIYKT